MRSADAEAYAVAATTARERILIRAFREEPMDPQGDQIGALLDVARNFHNFGIPFALIGGIAVGIHSRIPRATECIDIAVPSTIERAAIADALTGAGIEQRGEFAHSLNFRHASGEPIQIAFDPPFDPMIQRAEAVEIFGVAIPVVLKPDLIAMKERAAGDPARRRSKALRDQADVELLRGDVPGPDEGW